VREVITDREDAGGNVNPSLGSATRTGERGRIEGAASVTANTDAAPGSMRAWGSQASRQTRSVIHRSTSGATHALVAGGRGAHDARLVRSGPSARR